MSTTVPLRRVARFIYGDALSSGVREDGEVPVIGSGGVSGFHTTANTHGPAIVVGRKGSYGAIHWLDPDCFVIDTAYSVQPVNNETDMRWLYYALQAVDLKGSSQDVGVPGLSRETAYSVQLPLSPPDEQRRIADFLDAETARIDQLIAARRTQSDRLGELWDARLAATIDERARMHGWITLRRVVTSVEQGWSPQCDDVIAEPDEWAVLKTSAVSSGEFAPLEHKRLPADVQPDPRYQVLDGDILLTRGSGSLDHVGMAAEAKTEGRQLLLSDLLYRIRLQRSWSPAFVALALRSQPVRGRMGLLFRGQSGQTIKLRAEDIRSIEVPDIPTALQTQISAELFAERTTFRSVSQSIESSLSLLAERRQALITAAVTGGITV